MNKISKSNVHKVKNVGKTSTICQSLEAFICTSQSVLRGCGSYALGIARRSFKLLSIRYMNSRKSGWIPDTESLM